MSQQGDKKQSSLYGVFFFPVVILCVLIIVAMLAMSYSGNRRPAPAVTGNGGRISPQLLQTLRDKYDALGESMGNPNAPVTIREFGDYQCPACGRFEPTAERIRKKYVKTGKVRFIFFDFPLPMHAHAQAAAVAARCAARQNKFWPYHNRLYHTQSQWANASDPTSQFLDIGLETGLNTAKLKACMSANKPLPTIKAERKAGEAIRLQATPTILVDRTEFIGGPSYDKLKSAIETALANARAKD